MAQKIVVKKVKVGIPIKRVTSGAFAITNLGGVSTTGMQGGSLLIRDQGQQKFVVGTIVGAGGAGVSYDSANNRYSIDTQQFSAIDSSLIPSEIPHLTLVVQQGSGENYTYQVIVFTWEVLL